LAIRARITALLVVRLNLLEFRVSVHPLRQAQQFHTVLCRSSAGFAGPSIFFCCCRLLNAGRVPKNDRRNPRILNGLEIACISRLLQGGKLIRIGTPCVHNRAGFRRTQITLSAYSRASTG
jgi:hypothetical protein